MSVDRGWVSTSGLMYITCGSGVDEFFDKIGRVEVLSGGLFFEGIFNPGESVSSAGLDLDGC